MQPDSSLEPATQRLMRHERTMALESELADDMLPAIVGLQYVPEYLDWNQTVFAAPMIGLYIISIGIAWAASPRDRQSCLRSCLLVATLGAWRV